MITPPRGSVRVEPSGMTPGRWDVVCRNCGWAERSAPLVFDDRGTPSGGVLTRTAADEAKRHHRCPDGDAP